MKNFTRKYRISVPLFALLSCAALVAGCSAVSKKSKSLSSDLPESGEASSAAETAELASIDVPGTSLDERKEIKRAEEEVIATAQKQANEACGAELGHLVDWTTFVGKAEGNASFATAGHMCASVFQGIESACADDAAKEAIKANIEKVVCRWDDEASKEKLGRYGPSFEIKEKELHSGYRWERNDDDASTANIDSATREWLGENL